MKADAATPDDGADVLSALDHAKRIYLTTWSGAGSAGTVPVWFMRREGALYFTTQKSSIKARRIRTSGRVRINVGRATGPAFDARAEWVEGRRDIEDAILAAYRRKYPILVPLFMGRFIRKRLARGESVVIKVTPEPVVRA